MTTAEKEAYVRSRWEFVQLYSNCDQSRMKCGPVSGGFEGAWVESREDAISAAYKYTLAHEEEIRQVDDEIIEVEELCAGQRSSIAAQINRGEDGPYLIADVATLHRGSRILGRLQALRAELTKGTVQP